MKTKNQSHLSNYLAYCTAQKKLDSKTIKSYMIDLYQFLCFIEDTEIEELSIPILHQFSTCTLQAQNRQTQNSVYQSFFSLS